MRGVQVLEVHVSEVCPLGQVGLRRCWYWMHGVTSSITRSSIRFQGGRRLGVTAGARTQTRCVPASLATARCDENVSGCGLAGVC